MTFFQNIILELLSWSLMLLIRLNLLKKIKRINKQKYLILTKGKKSWLERGFYSPADSGLVWRLHKYILNGKEGVSNAERLFYWLFFIIFLAGFLNILVRIVS